jgi:hypothetical protein
MKPSPAAAIFSLLVAACSSASGIETVSHGSAAATVSGPPTISFKSDWSVGTNDVLPAGSIENVSYALTRLPQCRGSTDGVPAWVVHAHYSVDGGAVTTMTFFGNQLLANPQGLNFAFEIPFGRDLAFWFDNQDYFGCLGWDSDFGANFHFAIQAPTVPVIHFRRDWSIAVDNGTLAPGEVALVDYDIARLPQCRGQGWKVVMHAHEPSASWVVDSSVTQDTGLGTVPQAVQLSTVGGNAATVWFENTDTTGCQAWDSNFGQNFTITF